MAVIPLGERPPQPQQSRLFTPFALGFRPFFALAGLAGVVLMGIWLATWFGLFSVPPYYGLVGWHSHEMLFGYTSAVIAGFLLTAVRNWTGIDTPVGKPLAALALVWLAGRLVPYITLLPAALIAFTDLLFLPLLAAALYVPLMRAENRINRIFLPMLAAMTLANLLIHLQSLGMADSALKGTNLMLGMILLLLTLVSGRVLPFFAEKAVEGAKPRNSKQRELWVFLTLIAWILVDLIFPDPWLLAVLAVGVATTQLWRLFDWHHPGIWHTPILWVLYTGVAWMIMGFSLKAAASLGLFPDNLAIHALTSGAVGVLTLGMMARVALGHTGRPLQPSRLVEISFLILNLAILIRVFAPFLFAELNSVWLMVSGGLWILCFLLFTLHYLPILIRPRIDGNPG